MSKKQVVHAVIHAASAAAAAVGSGLAQVPGSDSAVIVPIQMAMIKGIAKIHGKVITKAAAFSIISTKLATVIGRKVSQYLWGWIPGWGNAWNASTAAAITEALGWTAHKIFKPS